MFIRLLTPLFSSGLALAAYAATFPALTYSTYLRDNFTPKAIATDSSGNIYIAGNAMIDPTTAQTTALVVKLNPQATQYLYLRYLGGSVADNANAIAVDGAGNAYIAGSTQSPDFPVTAGGNLGALPTGASGSQRSFVAKLDPGGNLLFSDLLGGSTVSAAQSVALTAAGQIVVSGLVISTTGSPGFPTTPGAYNIPNSANHPYLLELDPTGAKAVFSATGIGGSALALDSSGNIYVAGSTIQSDYPTTPGAYQTTFPTVLNCTSVDCAFPFPGFKQYVTKVDPTGSKLIYSTAVSGTRDTSNGGLAVDAAGNVYITGFAGSTYPYTVAVPSLPVEQSPFYLALPFLSKLDPAGKTLLFSVPVGGAGVKLDSSGGVYVGGYVGTGIPGNFPALANIPSACLPPVSPGVSRTAAYAAEVDAATGNLLGTRYIGGSTLALSGIALSGNTLWSAGPVSRTDFPYTPNALTVSNIGPGDRPGAYLGAVDFSASQPPAGTPQIACILDSASFSPAGPVARNQVLTILGSGLGPSAAATASDNSTTSLGGVSITFGPTPAPLLYASSTQINLAVPLLSFTQSSAAIGLTVNGVAAGPIQLPLTSANPSLFPVTLNQDGSPNSPSNGSPPASTVSVFLNGLSGLPPEYPQENHIPAQLFTADGWSVTNLVPLNPFVLRVDLKVPPALAFGAPCPPAATPCFAGIGFRLYYFDTESGAIGPLNGQAVGGTVYITVPQ